MTTFWLDLERIPTSRQKALLQPIYNDLEGCFAYPFAEIRQVSELVYAAAWSRLIMIRSVLVMNSKGLERYSVVTAMDSNATTR
jgi:hypothetical protein